LASAILTSAVQGSLPPLPAKRECFGSLLSQQLLPPLHYAYNGSGFEPVAPAHSHIQVVIRMDRRQGIKFSVTRSDATNG